MVNSYPKGSGTLPAPNPVYAAGSFFKWPSFNIFAVLTVVIHVIRVEANTVINTFNAVFMMN